MDNAHAEGVGPRSMPVPAMDHSRERIASRSSSPKHTGLRSRRAYGLGGLFGMRDPERASEGAGGGLEPKSLCKFLFFPQCSLWSLGGGGSREGYTPSPSDGTAILILPWGNSHQTGPASTPDTRCQHLLDPKYPSSDWLLQGFSGCLNRSRQVRQMLSMCFLLVPWNDTLKAPRRALGAGAGARAAGQRGDRGLQVRGPASGQY